MKILICSQYKTVRTSRGSGLPKDHSTWLQNTY